MSQVHWCWTNLRGSFRRIWQNIRWGWNESDVWSLDVTIAKFILPRLKYLKKVKQGCPILDGYEHEDSEEQFDKMHKEWDCIMDKMIQTFEWIINDNDDLSDTCEKENVNFHLPFKFIPCNDGSDCSKMELDGTPEQIKEHDIIFKKYMDLMEEREKEIQKGLALFAKYYRGLWD